MRKLYLLLIAVFVFLPSINVDAAELYFEQEQEVFGTSQAFEVPILLSSGEDRINAIEGELVIPGNHIIEMTITGNSVISHWIVEPTLIEDRIKFSGIIPGGYTGEGARLFSVIIRTQDEGSFTLTFENVHAFLHDGIPTKANIEEKVFHFSVNRGVSLSQGVPSSLNDSVAPEKFYPTIVEEKHLYDGKSVLVFSAQDKGSGIDYFTIKEGNGEAEVVTSPYLLKNQRILQRLEVTAYDLRGNQRTVIVHPQNPLSLEWQLVILLGFILFISIVYIIFKRMRFYEIST